MPRVDCSANDFEWSLQMSRVPSVLLVPADSTSDSILYNSEQGLSEEKLLQFILFNSDNPSTLQQFFRLNFNHEKTSIFSKFQSRLIYTVSKKISSIENEATTLKQNILFFNKSQEIEETFEGDSFNQAITTKLNFFNNKINILKQLLVLFQK